jgi:succinate dehydrogenase / fumarate reductase cytochrome b subunit
MDGHARPLSPHLQVYRWQITMWLSSLHRITGLLLSLGAVVLAVWLLALASGPEAYEEVRGTLASPVLKALYVVWSFCLFFHMANGVRHLAWDVGFGFGRASIRSSGWTVVVVSLAATALFAAVAIV